MTVSTFTKVGSSYNWIAFAVDPNGKVYASNYGGGVSTSTDHMDTFSSPMTGKTTECHGIFPANDGSTTMFAAFRSDGVYRSTNGTSWSAWSNPSVDSWGLIVTPGGDIWVTIYGGGCRRQVGGRDDSSAAWSTPGALPVGTVRHLAVDKDGKVYASNGNVLYSTTNGGSSWTTESDPVPTGGNTYPALVVSPASGDLYCLQPYGASKQYHSGSWESIPTSPSASASGEQPGAGKDGYVYASFGTDLYRQYTEPPAASGPANLKSLNTNLKANIKSINTNLIANVKSLNTNA